MCSPSPVLFVASRRLWLSSTCPRLAKERLFALRRWREDKRELTADGRVHGADTATRREATPVDNVVCQLRSHRHSSRRHDEATNAAAAVVHGRLRSTPRELKTNRPDGGFTRGAWDGLCPSIKDIVTASTRTSNKQDG